MISLFKSIIKSISKSVYHDPELRKITNRFPRFFRFIKKRLTPNEKFGLGLTIGAIFTLFFIYIFYVILRNLIGQDQLTIADKSIFNFVAVSRGPILNQIMLFITYLGKGEAIILGLIFVSIILFLLHRRYYLYSLIISVSIGELFVWLIKNIVERPRPPIANALVTENTYSFPSGHTFVAVAFYGLLTYFLIRFVRSKWLKRLIFFLGFLIIILIGISRIYLGAHWTSDVIASYASGLAWLSILITITKIKNPEIKKPHIDQKLIYRLSFLFFITWIAFVYFFYKTHPLKATTVVSQPKTEITQNITQNIFEKTSRYSATIFGGKIEPINIIVVGNQYELEQTLSDAKWLPLDTFNLKNLIVLSKRSFLRQSYPKAPGFPSFWNCTPNDLEFNKPTDRNSAQERYHIHLWQTNYTINQQQIWVATTHFDRYQETILPFHFVDSALDSAREKFKDALLGTGGVSSFSLIDVVDPTMGKNLLGNQFFTDGKAYLIFLK